MEEDFYDTGGMDDFEVDPMGDFFGDYKDYGLEEFTLAEEDGYKEILTHNGDSDDNEGIAETSLEPNWLSNMNLSTSSSNDTEASSGVTQGAN